MKRSVRGATPPGTRGTSSGSSHDARDVVLGSDELVLIVLTWHTRALQAGWSQPLWQSVAPVCKRWRELLREIRPSLETWGELSWTLKAPITDDGELGYPEGHVLSSPVFTSGDGHYHWDIVLQGENETQFFDA